MRKGGNNFSEAFHFNAMSDEFKKCLRPQINFVKEDRF